MRKFAIGIIIACAALFGLSGVAHADIPDEDWRPPRTVSPVYEVQEGDVLSDIAPQRWREVAADNSIIDPHLIHPGDRINLRVLHDPEAFLEARIQADLLDAWFEAVTPQPQATPVAEAESSSSPDRHDTAPAPSPPAQPVASGSVWDQHAECESGGNWALNTGNGYYGGLQFSLSSWQGVGGTGYPHEHSRETQIAMGQRLQASQGWGAWPACSAELGLR